MTFDVKYLANILMVWRSKVYDKCNNSRLQCKQVFTQMY